MKAFHLPSLVAVCLFGILPVCGQERLPNEGAGAAHWAFQPVRRPKIPEVRESGWLRTSVDAFVLVQMEAQRLTPSPTASRAGLIRRVSFDVRGLPPTPDEVREFENDPSADAYERMVERMLASPAYGERWGRHWLDVARYSDTKGYVFFEEKEFPWAYTYRDYIIEALNEDRPYNRFILEQLAADRLDLATDRRALRALGFLTLGGRFMNNVHDIIDDRIDVVTRGLLGLTVGCARCHDHKYDPVSSKDYYSLYGVFASCTEPTVPALFQNPPNTETYAAFEKELSAREQKLTEFIQQKHREVVSGARTRVGSYMLAAHALRNQPDTDEFMLLADGSDLNPTMIVRWKSFLERTRTDHRSVFSPWHEYASLAEKEFATKAPIITARLRGEESNRGVNALVCRKLVEKDPRKLDEVAQVYGELFQAVERNWQEVLSKSQVAGNSLDNPAQEELRQVLYGRDTPANVAPGQYSELALLPDRPAQAKLQELRKAVEQWRATGAGAPPRAMTLEDRPTPHESRVFLRGNPNQLGESAPRRFLAVLSGKQSQPFTRGSGRLELAEAIASPENPLTARVLVNRLWMHHFGTPLVGTPGDFGLRSDPPRDPQLLDWLADEFVRNDWSLKHLHRLILLSSVYQQVSRDRPECSSLDPENRLMWKMNRRRQDFESLRDNLLAVSARLSSTIGGPSRKDILNAGLQRRTMYGFLDRLNVPGLYRTFDFPNPDTTCPQRDRTTVAPQALFLMNHPFAHECARQILQRPEITAERDGRRRIVLLYPLLFGRAATERETAAGLEFLGSAPGDGRWTGYVQALMLTNEFAFVE